MATKKDNRKAKETPKKKAAKAQTAQNAQTLTTADITPAPWNPRGEITPESVAELAASIREQGLISPIVVWLETETNTAYCIAGNRRLAAMKSIGYALRDGDYVPFMGDEREAREITITENLQRRDLSPVDEAQAVTDLLDLGATVYSVAAKLGKSPRWVYRRRKLAALVPEWKAKADQIDADALEHIAEYPPEVQTKCAAACAGWAAHWAGIASYFDRESRDLDRARFVTEPCAECPKRTGCAPDLFGIRDGELGKCQDAKCYAAKARARLDAEIARLTDGAETVRVKYAWQLPAEKESTEARDEAHPCAYICVYNDAIESIRWAESAKARREREAADKARREAETERENAERKREREIVAALDEWKDNPPDGEEYPQGLAGLIAKCLAPSCDGPRADFVIDAIADKITGWHTAEEWADIIRAFPEIRDLAGLEIDAADYLCGAYPAQ